MLPFTKDLRLLTSILIPQPKAMATQAHPPHPPPPQEIANCHLRFSSHVPHHFYKDPIHWMICFGKASPTWVGTCQTFSAPPTIPIMTQHSRMPHRRPAILTIIANRNSRKQQQVSCGYYANNHHPKGSNNRVSPFQKISSFVNI